MTRRGFFGAIAAIALWRRPRPAPPAEWFCAIDPAGGADAARYAVWTSSHAVGAEADFAGLDEAIIRLNTALPSWDGYDRIFIDDLVRSPLMQRATRAPFPGEVDR